MKSKRRPKRIKRTRSATLPAALLLTCVVAGATVFFMQPEQVRSVAPVETVRVAADHDMVLIPTPTRAIARGERLGDVEFAKIKWPKERLNQDFLLTVTEYRDAVATTPLPKFIPVPLTAISRDPLDANAVVEGIPNGMRAITVRVDAESAVEGWARSGNFVDVILIRSAKREGELEAKIIAENVRILSAGRSVKPLDAPTAAPQAPKTVTLLVSQEAALKIKAAQNMGKLTFALRGRGDEDPAVVRKVNERAILGGAKSIQVQERFKGYARDDKGRLFVYKDRSGWKRANQMPSELDTGANEDEDRASVKEQPQAEAQPDAAQSAEAESDE